MNTNNIDPKQVMAAIKTDLVDPGWVGYVDSYNAVHAVRLSRQDIQEKEHGMVFGASLASVPHRFRMPIEAKAIVYWWEDPTDDARIAVDDFFAGKGIEVNGHISMGSGGRVAMMPTKVGDRMYRVGQVRFHKVEAAQQVAQKCDEQVVPVVFTKTMCWRPEA